MSEAKDESKDIVSVFQKKYDEFVEDLLGALPEYTEQIQFAKSINPKDRLERFQAEVKFTNTMNGGDTEDFQKNPNTILPSVTISNEVWATLSDNTKKAIWEHVRVLSICCFMEAGFGQDDKPKWMEDAMAAAMEDMKKKVESDDFKNMLKKFMDMMKASKKDDDDDDEKEDGAKASSLPNLDDIFKNGFPNLPE